MVMPDQMQRVNVRSDPRNPALTLSVERSWLRSEQAGLRPDDEPYYDHIATPPRRRHERQADRQLWQYTREEIEHLWNAFGGNDWVVMCINPEGEIIHARHSPYSQETVLKPIEPGRRLREELTGTTAPSCVLHERQHAVVGVGEHYLKAFSRVFCLAVPLFDADGEVAGILDITGVGQRDIFQLQAYFQRAALLIHQRFFFALKRCHLLSVQYDSRLLGSHLAGIVAIDEDGGVRSISQQARSILGLHMFSSSPKLNLRSLFPCARSAQLRRFLQPSSRPQRILLENGTHVWVKHLRSPASRFVPGVDTTRFEAGGSEVETASVRGTLEENTLSAIELALHENNGNIAAASRQLGISRTTLYSKLRRA